MSAPADCPSSSSYVTVRPSWKLIGTTLERPDGNRADAVVPFHVSFQARRVEAGMSIDDVAAQIGASSSYIASIERNEIYTSLDIERRLMNALASCCRHSD